MEEEKIDELLHDATEELEDLEDLEDDDLDDDLEEVDLEAEARREEERAIAEIPDLPIPASMSKEDLVEEAYRMRKIVVAQDAREKGMIIELDYLRNELKGARRQIVKMKYHLEELQEEYDRERLVASNCAGILREFLFKWLTPDNQLFVKRVFRFYDDYDQIRVMYAVLKYLLFGQLTSFHREVQKWHFKLICDKIDEDAIVLPSHTLMVKLMKKYGLIKAIENYGISESDSSEKEQASGEGDC